VLGKSVVRQCQEDSENAILQIKQRKLWPNRRISSDSAKESRNIGRVNPSSFSKSELRSLVETLLEENARLILQNKESQGMKIADLDKSAAKSSPESIAHCSRRLLEVNKKLDGLKMRLTDAQEDLLCGGMNQSQLSHVNQVALMQNLEQERVVEEQRLRCLELKATFLECEAAAMTSSFVNSICSELVPIESMILELENNIPFPESLSRVVGRASPASNAASPAPTSRIVSRSSTPSDISEWELKIRGLKERITQRRKTELSQS
jgi:hypothetical protein